MFHRVAAQAHTRALKFREALERRAAGRRDDDGLESIEVVVLSVVGLGIVVALGAAIKALVTRYQAGITDAPALP